MVSRNIGKKLWVRTKRRVGRSDGGGGLEGKGLSKVHAASNSHIHSPTLVHHVVALPHYLIWQFSLFAA